MKGYVAVLPPQASFSELWPHLRSLRTYGEQVRAYLKAFEDRRPAADDNADLRQDAREEWPILEQAITSEKARRRVVPAKTTDACPKCNMMLPKAEAFKLRTVGVATAKGCCSRVVIWPGN